MNKSLAIVLGTAALLAAGTPLAQGVKTQMAPSSTTATQSVSPMMGRMDEHMKKMQTLHENMASATAPDERQKLMTEQRQEMQQGMTIMQDMHRSAHVMDGAGTDMKGKPADQHTQMRMMDQRMDMMQTMMQLMLDQQGGSSGAMTPAPAK